jgi:nicotinamidase-related amidase
VSAVDGSKHLNGSKPNPDGANQGDSSTAGRGGPLDADALLVLDIFNTFDFPGGDELAAATRGLIPTLVSLRERFHKAGLPVIYINDNLGRWSDSFEQIVSFTVASHATTRSIQQSLAPGEGDFKLLKPRHSAFFETPLQSLLSHLGARRIVIAGIAGDYCVLSTALDACVRELQVIVPSDAIASQSTERNERVLSHLAETCNIPTPRASDVGCAAPGVRGP